MQGNSSRFWQVTSWYWGLMLFLFFATGGGLILPSVLALYLAGVVLWAFWRSFVWLCSALPEPRMRRRDTTSESLKSAEKPAIPPAPPAPTRDELYREADETYRKALSWINSSRFDADEQQAMLNQARDRYMERLKELM